MANYNWAVDSSGQWTTPSNWGSTTYPNNLADNARFSKGLTAPRTVTVSSNVSVLSLSFAVGGVNVPNYTIAGSSRITFASTGRIEVASSQFINANTNIFPQIVSQPTSPIGIRSQSVDRKVVLKNETNQIYQIGTAGTFAQQNISVGFDSVACLGIQHPTHIYDSSITSTSGWTASLHSEGTGGTLAKNFWVSGTFDPSLHLYSNGTSPFRVGVVSDVVRVSSLTLNGSMALSSETNDNELINSVYHGGTQLNKYGSCRWILSGAITGPVTSVIVRDGALQLPLARINAATYATVSVQTSASSCLEVSGSGTVRSGLSVVLNSNVVGTNRMGAFRATSNSSITVSTLTMNAGAKVAAALGATLVISTFVNNPQNSTLYFGGEGTVELQYALGGTSTTVAIVKEDSGTLKMSTNNKTYLAPTNINSGTVLCDGPSRISGSDLITVANAAKLRSSFVGTTALSVKALTLQAGSIVQVD